MAKFGQFQGAPREHWQPVLNPNPHQWSAARVAGAYLIAGFLWIGLSDLTLAESGGLTASGFLVSAGKGILFVVLSGALVFWLCRREFRNTARTMALLRTVVDGTTDAVFVKDREGRYLLVNEAAAQFLGRSVADIIGRDDRELFEADEAERLMERDRKIMAGRDSVMIEEELTSAGIRRTYQATKTPYLDAAGQAAGLIGIGRNVTDRVQVEAALRESDARLREAQRIARLGSWSWEPPTNKVWWSDAEFELFGLDPNAVQPGLESFLALLHPDDRPTALARVDAMLAGANEFANDLRVILRDGTWLWIHSQARATRDASGTLLRVEGTDQDVTAQHLAREAAAESEQKLQAAVEVAELGIILVDYEHQTVDLSPRAAQQFGLTQVAPMTRSDLHARFHPDDSEQLEDQLRQSQKMEAVGRLAGGVAHDFNNLLTVINGYSELLLSDLPVEAQAREPLAAIHDAGERAARLTKQLLALSRKSMIEPRLIDLNELVAESAKLFRRLIGEDIALLVLADPAPVRVVIDPGQIEQVLMNLVVNARDAMPTGGRLTIETRNVEHGLTVDRSQTDLPPGRYALLQVSDTGCGMSQEIMEKIFEPFFTTKGVGQGSGLGLAVVHGVVQQSGGSIRAQSVEGKGTSFKILLPATQDIASESVLSETSASLEGGETVLVVEDEEAVCKLVRLSLEEHAYKVFSAATGRDALELLQSHSGTVDLLITDVIMPGMSGRELAEAARRERPGLRILYMSGYTDDALGRHGMAETSDQFLQKPFTPLGLLRKVRTILDHSENT